MQYAHKFNTSRACCNLGPTWKEELNCHTETYFGKWMFHYIEVHKIPGILGGKGLMTTPRIEAAIPFHTGQERENEKLIMALDCAAPLRSIGALLISALYFIPLVG